MSVQTEDGTYLRDTLAMAMDGIEAGHGPFAALVVRDGKVIGKGHNRVTLNNDPTAHAELEAIREACRQTGDFSLEGATLYVSCEPCPMCLAAAYWAHIERVVYAASSEDAAKAGFDDLFVREELVKPSAERRLSLSQSLGEEGRAVFRRWLAYEQRIEY